MSGFGWLCCPCCDEPLAEDTGALRCSRRHSFDVARQGYVNLLGRASPANADTAPMLEARSRFLGRGHFLPIAQAVVEAVAGARRIVETGAGTGWYLAQVLDATGADGLATDVSVAAARRAARAHPRARAVVADTWSGLPVRDGIADAVLCIFAPRNAGEFARILAPEGCVVTVLPRSDHLEELRNRHGLLGIGQDKTASLKASFPGWIPTQVTVTSRLHLDATDVADLLAMGPNAFHRLPESPEPCTTTLAVDVVTLTRAKT